MNTVIRSVVNLDQHQVCTLAQEVLGVHVEFTGQVLGARKQAMFVRCPATDKQWVVLLCAKQHMAHLRSGLAIQARMAAHGIPVASVVWKDLSGDYSGYPMVIAERLPGVEIMGLWNSLTEDQTPGIARAVAGIVALSEEEFTKITDQSSVRVGVHLHRQSPQFSSVRAYLSTLMESSRDHAGSNRHWEVAKQAAILDDFLNGRRIAELVNDALLSTFIPDLIDRNLLIEDGEISGLVDMDELMTGDTWMLPSTAEVYLSMVNFKHTKLYVDTWVNAWQPSDADTARMLIYRAVIAIERASRAGTRTPTGVIRKNVPPHLLEDWMTSALSV